MEQRSHLEKLSVKSKYFTECPDWIWTYQKHKLPGLAVWNIMTIVSGLTELSVDLRFSLLIVIFDVDLSRVNFLNYDKKLVKIKYLISQWSTRRLTPMGRLTVIKTLLISQFKSSIYFDSQPSKQFLRELKDVIYTFLWNSNVDKVKKKTLSLKTTRTADWRW